MYGYFDALDKAITEVEKEQLIDTENEKTMFFFGHTALAALIQNKIAKIFMPKLNFFIICVSKLRVYIIMNISRKIKI
jgi:hypothetical protein